MTDDQTGMNDAIIKLSKMVSAWTLWEGGICKSKYSYSTT